MRWLTLVMGLLVTGCGAMIVEDHSATLSAENRSFVTEAAQIRETLTAQEAHVQGTAVAGETVVAQQNNVNALLLATVRAGDPPTVAVRAQLDRSVGALGSGAASSGPVASGNPGGEVVTTYTSPAVLDANGCGTEQRFQFEMGTARIFAVQEVRAIPANTLVGIEWYYDGGVVFEDQLLVTEYADNLCLWFYLEPYSTGEWGVQFLSNGNFVGSRVNFRVGE